MKRASPINDPPRKLANRSAVALAAIVGFVLFSSTLLLCDVSGVKPGEQWPWLIDRLLAVPIQLTDVSDLRYYAIPMGLAGMLLIPGPVSTAGGRRARIWFEALGLATILWAAGSALMNGTWDQSRGWVFSLTCGVAWAAFIGRRFDASCVRGSLVAGSGILLFASVLSLLHRFGLGERFFQLPVGPITLTASLGALWCAVAGVWLVGVLASKREGAPVQSHRRSPTVAQGAITTKEILVGIAILAASLALLLASSRRGAWMGLMAAWSAVAALVIWDKYRTRFVRIALLVVMLVVMTAAAWYVRSQSHAAEVAVSLPLRVRSIYWGKMLEGIPKSPLWGFGPDEFVVKTTTALSRQRAEEPRILHGTIDFDGHNEWLQAAFELGIPGALLYVALPVSVLVVAGRRWREATGARRIVLLALMAGLTEICVAEASSINLRYSILPGWFWTILGLTLAVSRQGPALREPLQMRVSKSRRTVSLAARTVAVAFLIGIVAMDLRAAVHHASGRALLTHDDAQATHELELATGRLGASRWLATRNYLGASLSNQVRPLYEAGRGSTGDTGELSRRAIVAWTELFDACPGYLDCGFRLAEAQMMAGDAVSARKTLATVLTELNPYDRNANVLEIQVRQLGPVEKLECVRRALRQEAWEPVIFGDATECFKASEVMANWPARVTQALRDVAQPSEKDWKDALAPETLRIEAVRLIGAGDRAGAERIQYAAALAYDRLARVYANGRRKWPAEVDAWHVASQCLFDLDPTRYEEAFARISRAEDLFVDGVLTQSVPNAARGAELLGGRVLPLELPEKLSPLWRFSAMMHLAMKKEPRQIDLRITWSLPAEQRSPARTMAEMGQLSAELVAIFQSQPESKRPPSYRELLGFASQYRRP